MNKTIVLSLVVDVAQAQALQRFLERCVTDPTVCGIADWASRHAVQLQEYTIKEKSDHAT